MPESSQFDVKQKKVPSQPSQRIMRGIMFLALGLLLLGGIGLLMTVPMCAASTLSSDKDHTLETKAYTTSELIRIFEAWEFEGKISLTTHISSGAAWGEFECHYTECVLKTFSVNVASTPSALCASLPLNIESEATVYEFYSNSHHIEHPEYMDMTYRYGIGNSWTRSLGDIRPTMEDVIAQYNNPFMTPDYRLVIRTGADKWFVKAESSESNVEYEVLYQRIEHK